MDQNRYDDEAEPLPAAGAPRALVPAARHDGFTPDRRRKFLRTLRKTGCVRDACRVAEISDSAAYKARRRDRDFRALWDSALSKAAGDMELLAWQRAVDGIEESVFAYGKVVGTRRRRDPQLFRMMLQASNPEKYGGQGFGSRKALEKKIRAQIAAEQEEPTMHPDEREEVTNRLLRKIAAVRRRMIQAGKGYENEQGQFVPAGYVRAEPDPEPQERFERDEGAAPGADWPDPEPFSGASEAGSGARTEAEPTENRRSGPRITVFRGF